MNDLCPRQKAVLNLIKKDEIYENYFFKKVSDKKWFYHLKKMGYFDSKRAPGSLPAGEEGYYYMPEWNVLPYLERLSSQHNIPDYDNYSSEIIEIIKNVSNHINEKGEHIDNYRTWWFFIKILVNIPNKKIDDSIINLIQVWLDSKFDTMLQISEITERFLPKFLYKNSDKEDIKKAENIIKYITKIKEVEASETDKKYFRIKKRYEFKGDIYWLEKYFEQNAKLIAQKCSNNVINDFEIKIINMLKKPEDRGFRSIYEKRNINNPFDLLYESLKNILKEKAKQNPKQVEEILCSYLNHKYYIFHKISIYVLAHNAVTFNDLIWKHIDLIIGESFKRQILVGDELKHLLNNFDNLKEYQRKRLIKIIEEGPTKDLTDEEKEEKKIIWRQRLYQALSHDPQFKQKYNEIKKQTNKDAELSPAVSFFATGGGSDKSPLSKEEILEIKNEDLAKFFIDFKESSAWEGPTIDGLCRELKETIKEKPEKFVSDLSPFIKSGYIYVFHMLWGLRDAWKEKNSFEWEKLFDFIEKYINQKEFWEEKLKIKFYHGDADHKWVLKLIGELIQEGTKSDEWAFRKELISKAETLLIDIKNKLFEYRIDEKKEIDDPVTQALNSVYGNIITAMLFLALRKARIKGKEKNKNKIKWTDKIKEFFEEMMENKIPESFTIFGEYFPNFVYLDKNWSFSRAESFIEKEDGVIEKEDAAWENFFTGYLYWGKVYLDIFDKMREHYKKGVENKFKDKTARERLVHHLAIVYLAEKIELTDESLMIQLINNENSEDMETLINFLRNQYSNKIKRKLNNKDIKTINKEKERVIDLWKYFYEKYANVSNPTEEQKRIISSLLKLTIYIDEFDEEKFKFITFSISHLVEFYSVHIFLEDLIRIKENKENIETARYISKIMIELLKTTTPSTFKDHIRILVEFLYSYSNEDRKIKDAADEICNTYAERGVYDEKGNLFLRDLYDKYN